MGACLEHRDPPTLLFGNGRAIRGVDLSELAEFKKTPEAVIAAPREQPTPGTHLASPQIKIAVLGNVQVSGAPESFRYRRRLTELVSFSPCILKAPPATPSQPPCGPKDGFRSRRSRTGFRRQGGHSALQVTGVPAFARKRDATESSRPAPTGTSSESSPRLDKSRNRGEERSL